MPFDVKAAKAAGYTDDEILPYLRESYPDFDVDGALKSGYAIDEVGEFLNAPAPSKPSGLEKAAAFSEGLLDTVTAPIQPAARAIGKTVSGIEEASKQASEREAELAGSKGQLPISAVVPAIPEIAIKSAKKPFEILKKVGEKLAEKGGEKGYPKTGAALGTVTEMLPDLLAGGAGIAKRAVIGKGLKAAAEGTTRAATAPFRAAADALKAPSVELNLQDQIANLATRKAAEGTKLDQIRRSFGGEIEAARTRAGIPQEPLSSLPIPKDINEFADSLRDIAKRSPDDLLAAMGPKGIAQLKDTIQAVRESGQLKYGTRASAQVNEGAKVLDDALSKVSSEIGEKLSLYRKTQQQVEGLPEYYRGLKADLQAELRRTRASSGKKALIAAALKGGAGALGAGAAGGTAYTIGKSLGLY